MESTADCVLAAVDPTGTGVATSLFAAVVAVDIREVLRD